MISLLLLRGGREREREGGRERDRERQRQSRVGTMGGANEDIMKPQLYYT